MAVIQFSIDSQVFLSLMERAARLGMSEHQLAKCLVGLADVTDEEILLHKRNQYAKRLESRSRARPL